MGESAESCRSEPLSVATDLGGFEGVACVGRGVVGSQLASFVNICTSMGIDIRVISR